MKFSSSTLVAITALFAVAKAQSPSSLRVPLQPNLSNSKKEVGAEIMVRHLKHDDVGSHDDVIQGCLVAAFNEVHPIPDYDLKGFEIKKQISFDDKDYERSASLHSNSGGGQMWLSDSYLAWGGLNLDCDMCEERLWPKMLQIGATPGAGDLHDEFEKTFCAMLRKTKVPVFAEADDCYIVYLYKPSNNDNSLGVYES